MSANTPNFSPKQALFIEEYLVDLNATAAAKRAGYSPKTAYSLGQRLLKKAEIQAAIRERREKLSDDINLTQQDILKGLLSEAVFMDLGSSHAARISAWKELGKILGHYELDNLQKGNAELMTRAEFVTDLMSSIKATTGLPKPRPRQLPKPRKKK